MSSTLTLRVLPAGHGDCMLIDYGPVGDRHRIVVDGGTSGTFPRLKEILEGDFDGSLDLLVVTHVDADHIAGALRLAQDEQLVRRFRDVWFNGRKHLEPEGAEPLGPKQGDRLTNAIEQLGLPWNSAFGGRAVCIGSDNSPRTVELKSGAKVTLLSPRPAHLQMLRFRWDLEVTAAGLLPSSGIQESQTVPPGLERMGTQAIDIERLAAQKSPSDTSIPNATSIAFLFEYDGKTLLLAADAHSDVLLNSGRVLRGGQPIPVEVFKLSHHGSECNVSLDLLMQFPSSRYVVSTNGAYHGHPDDVALARIAKLAPSATLLFNYPGEAYERWAEVATREGRPAAVFCGNGTGLVIPVS